MATPRNPLETFIWGSGGRAMTPEQVAREREIAAALTDQGADFSPVGHWLQGAARLGHSAAGAFRNWRADEAESAGRGALSDRWSSVFGGGSSPVAEALAGGVASPALDAANAVAAMPTGDMADRIRAGLMERGLPEHVANAFILNMQDESGLNPGINEAAPIVPGSRGGYGLYQLTGPRRRDYEAFAAERGVAPDDVDAQLDWLMHELSGPEARAAQSILSAQDTPTAAAAIVNEFLRPAEEHRVRRANAYMAGSGSMPNAQPVQVAQAGGSPSIAELLSLSGDPNFGYASPAQQQIVQSLMGQQLQQQDPAYQQGLAIGDVNLRRSELELDQLLNPGAPAPEYGFITMPDGTLVRTDKTSGDFAPLGQFAQPDPGWRALTADEAASYGIPAGTPAQINDGTGEVKGLGGVNVTTNVGDPEFGPTPAGYQLVRSPEGARLERIPGGPQEEEKVRDAEIAAETAERALGNIQSIVEDPNLGLAVGLGGFLPAIPNTPQAGLVTRINQLQGTAFLQAFETLRGGGQISNVEGQKAQEAIARLNRVQSQEDFINALNDLGEVVHTGLNRARREAGMEGLDDFVPFKASSGDSGQTGQSVADPSIFPAPGTMEDGYRFLGGDPADPNSWERVQ